MGADDPAPPAAAPTPRPCPICGKPAGVDYDPFCSKRCADVDLHRWLGGVYAVPDDEPGQTLLPDSESNSDFGD